MSDNAIAAAELRGTIDYTRQRDWFDPTKSDAHVTVVGCGGIGSPAALALGKLGIPSMTLVDGDTVEAHNLPNQVFPLAAVGLPKPEALADEVLRYSCCDVDAVNGFLSPEGIYVNDGEDTVRVMGPGWKPRGVVVSALDSMAARAEVWKTVKFNPQASFYVDARLGGENVVLYTANPLDYDSCAAYEQTLHSDGEASEAPCTRRSIIDVGFVVASLITRTVRRHLAGEQVEPLLFWNHASLRATVGS